MDSRPIISSVEFIKAGARSRRKAGRIASGKYYLRTSPIKMMAIGFVVWCAVITGIVSLLIWIF